MAPRPPAHTRKYPCERCPLRNLEIFRPFKREELEFVSHLKTGELTAEAGTTIMAEGSHSAHLLTVLSGWGFRYKLLENGNRQILNVILPGDFIGLQGAIMDEMQHSVEALSDMFLCVFERERLWELYRDHPGLAFDITWLASREEQVLDEHLLNLGQRTAAARTAFLLLFLFSRAQDRGMTRGASVTFPLTQQHVADMLGLSLVHTNRTLNQLARKKLIAWQDRTLRLLDRDALADLANWDDTVSVQRPYI
ncbi:Crp/Fnr family transcriptional regulator [Bauldia litoralis]|uniref:Crp/Fnr family transcriptional regulator n=1 Tax=Bauldia litoralis TaxID=665467 RepID=UPI003262FB5C